MLPAGGFTDVIPVTSSRSVLSVLHFFGLLPTVECNAYTALSVCEYIVPLSTMLTTHLNKQHINLMRNRNGGESGTEVN